MLVHEYKLGFKPVEDEIRLSKNSKGITKTLLNSTPPSTTTSSYCWAILLVLGPPSPLQALEMPKSVSFTCQSNRFHLNQRLIQILAIWNYPSVPEFLHFAGSTEKHVDNGANPSSQVIPIPQPAWPKLLCRTFSGFTSRCSNRLLWRCSKPRTTWAAMHNIRSGLRRTASPADDFGSTACASQSTLELNINPEPIHQSQMLYISFIPFTGTNAFFFPSDFLTSHPPWDFPRNGSSTSPGQKHATLRARWSWSDSAWTFLAMENHHF